MLFGSSVYAFACMTITFVFYSCCRNTKWKFLDDVKITCAPPSRKAIVQQCVRDLGILDVLCDYVSTSDAHYLITCQLVSLLFVMNLKDLHY